MSVHYINSHFTLLCCILTKVWTSRYQSRSSVQLGVTCGLADHDEQPVRIRLVDVNDEIPEFKNVPRPFLTTISANAPRATSVYQLMAQDSDEGSIVRYILESGEWSSSFTDRSSIVGCRFAAGPLTLTLTLATEIQFLLT